MLCPYCNKNEATIHFTEVINGKMQETHLCEECAAKKGIETSLPFSFGDILSAITKGIEELGNNVESEFFLENPECKNCGITIKDFIKQGRLGCPKCYDVFADAMNDIIKNIQKAPIHKGKIPKFFPRVEDSKKRIKELQTKLQKAVADERYEDCAAYRDEIKHLKQAIEKNA